MNQFLPIAAIAAVLGLAGCATPATTEAPLVTADSKESQEVITGSRIPRTVAQPVGAISQEAWKQDMKSGVANQGRGG